MATPQFDVFLCYNSEDRPAVKRIARKLRAESLRPWLDEWELKPGLPWQQALEEQIENVAAAAVFVGEKGMGPWQHVEQNALLRQFVKRNCPVIPVILAECQSTPRLPVFLDGMMWVDFRSSDPDPLQQLVWGITDKHPTYPGSTRIPQIPPTVPQNLPCESSDPATPVVESSTEVRKGTDATDALLLYVSNVIDSLCEEVRDDASGTSLADPRETFIATKCAPLFQNNAVEGESTDAFSWLSDRARKQESVLVLSNYGMGKTHLVLRLLASLVDRTSCPSGNRIPVFIPLRQVNYFPGIQPPDLFRQLWSIAFSNGLPVDDFREFELLLSEGNFWLIFDGIDEIPLIQIESDPVAVVRELRTLLGEACPQLFTSRPGLFATRIEEVHALFGANACLLAHWDEELWEAFLEHCYRSRVFDSLTEYQSFRNLVLSSPHLREFIVTPLYARMLVDARAALANGDSFDVTELYQEYVYTVLNRRKIPGIPDIARVACLQAIAVHLCLNRRSEANLDEIARLALQLAENIGSADIRRIVEHDLRRTSLLVSQGDDRLWFSHKSFFEYFSALSVLNELQNKPPWKDSQLLKHPLEEGILAFVGIHLARDDYSLTRAACLKELSSTRVTLLDDNIVRNLTKSLLSAGCDLSQLQFKKASLSGLDLSQSTMNEANFEGAFLADSNLEGSELKRCRFVQTHLKNCRFADADLTGSLFKSCFMDQLNKSGFSPCLANVTIERARMSREDGRYLEAAMLQSNGWDSEAGMRDAIAKMMTTARWTD